MERNNKPEALSAEDERYQVYSRFEIVSLLREVMESHAFVTIYFNQGSEFIVTNVLHVNPEFEELILDFGADQKANERLLAATRITVVTFLDHIKLQFGATRAEATTFEDTPALRIRLPESVLRLQRRNFYRIRGPVAKPLTASVANPRQPDERVELRILDISCGGIAVLAGDGFPLLDQGAKLEDCRIELPEFGIVRAVLEIRNSAPMDDGIKENKVRYGCQFVDLSGPTITLIQRYINKIERSRATKS
jgi:c-di-GMP-binding flagellar brake protein YcgR